jgi:CRP/FNR family cyclic AMP-dependent transcriptional regulator
VNKENVYWMLRNQSLFKDADAVSLKELVASAVLQTATKDEIIYSAEDVAEKLYILCRGRVKTAFKLFSSNEVVSEILKEGDIFGELTLRKSETLNNEFAQVLSDHVLIVSFGLNAFQNVLSRSPAMALEYAFMTAEKLKIISKKYADLAFKNARSRILNFFILHAQYEATWEGNKAEIEMYCTHKDIADFTASSRQTVSSVINDLIKENKIIYQGRSKLIIPDINKLYV